MVTVCCSPVCNGFGVDVTFTQCNVAFGMPQSVQFVGVSATDGRMFNAATRKSKKGFNMFGGLAGNGETKTSRITLTVGASR